jgi:hypothetical protein
VVEVQSVVEAPGCSHSPETEFHNPEAEMAGNQLVCTRYQMLLLLV